MWWAATNKCMGNTVPDITQINIAILIPLSPSLLGNLNIFIFKNSVFSQGQVVSKH